jgi:ribonucleoside-diphosphate reductase alpha chain
VLKRLNKGRINVNYEPFAPIGLGATIFKERYARYPEETFEQASKRVAEHVAQAEENGNIQKYSDRFTEQIASNRFMPGGRIWYGSGRPKAQLLNCFVVPTADSREGWGKTLSDVIVVSGLGGGVGVNCSPVRPRGSDIKGTGGTATGAVSLMQMIDRVGDVLVSGGGRRLALMLCLDLTHPDLEEFLNVKLDLDELTNANISVVIDIPTDEFVEKVKNNEEIDLVFGGRPTGRTIRAGDLWARLVENAWKTGEPGVLNGHYANQMNNIWYYKDLISTNPCGEIWLEEYGCCDLGALVLPRFVHDGEFDWDGLDESIRLGTRFPRQRTHHQLLPAHRDQREL